MRGGKEGADGPDADVHVAGATGASITAVSDAISRKKREESSELPPVELEAIPAIMRH